MNELIIGDQKYISSKQAAEVTGYTKDYVGQLCREGRVEARLVGRNWYVREAAIRDHRFGELSQEGAKTGEKPREVKAEMPKIDWQATYSPIEEPALPPLSPKTEEGSTEVPTAEEMQSAWQEWFATRESASPQQATEEASEVVEIKKIEPDIAVEEVLEEPKEPQEIESREEVVTLHRIPDQELVMPVIAQNLPVEAALPAKPGIAYIDHPLPARRAYRGLRVALAGLGIAVMLIAGVGTGKLSVQGQGSLASVISFINGSKTFVK